MESISIKLEKSLATEMASVMKAFHYSTTTEFIREALRKRIKDLRAEQEKEKAWQALYRLRGSLKGKAKPMSEEEWRAARDEAAEEYLQEAKAKFGLK